MILKHVQQLPCRMVLIPFAAGLLSLGGCGSGSNQTASDDGSLQSPVIVYSARAEAIIKPVFDAFTTETGIPVNYVIESEQVLIQKLIAEGDTTSADMLLTIDAGNLWYAAEEGELRPTYSEILESNIPRELRDPENQWFAMSVRARAIVYDARKVEPSHLTGYAGLADERWQGRLCLQSSAHMNSQSHVAMMIAQMGERDAEIVVRGWVNNLATSVFPDDAMLLRAIEAGQCQVGIANHYEVGQLQRENVATDVRIFWPSSETGGVYINVTGAGITRHAKNPDGARALLEWMSGDVGQRLINGDNLEYPANLSVPPSPSLAQWRGDEGNPMNVSKAGIFQADAVKLVQRANYR